MAVLSRIEDGPRGGRGWARHGFLAGALVFGGCVLMNPWGGEDAGPAFSHRVHVEDEGLDCFMCHVAEGIRPQEEFGGVPSMPPIDICMLCHEGMDDEKPPERRASAFYDEAGGILAVHASVLTDEIVFSHTAHVERSGEDCGSCHVGIDASERITPDDAVSMADCIACHEQSGSEDSCATCHSEIDQDWSPPSHAYAWKRMHGQAFHARDEQLSSRCTLCHTESSCVRCHQEEAPSNHDNFWRIRGHALLASLDRDNCATCHRDDFCSRCHETVEPRSHAGMWGSSRNNHCFACHFPLKNEGCATCHKSTPSHMQGAPQPPDHTSGADCRQCHGAGAPLPHADNGSACQFCHP